MNQEPTKSSPDRNDGKMGRRSLLGMTAASLAGSLVACATAPNSSTTSFAPRRRFEGKVVLITGATSGIGRAAALQFADEGAKVSFCGRIRLPQAPPRQAPDPRQECRHGASHGCPRGAKVRLLLSPRTCR
jgi:hypothetical protein